MTQLALNLTVGRARRDAGTAQTINTEADAWREAAMSALQWYAGRNPAFTAESFRYWWLSAGGEPPHSHKVWGALCLAAARAGIIVATGEYRKAASPGTHAHPVAVWRAA